MRYQRLYAHTQDYRRSNHLEVTSYFDLDYGSCLNDHKFASKYVFMLARGAISWKSAKQTVMTTLTMEVEYIACYEAICQAI